MSEPIALQDLFYGTMSGAAVVLFGAFYALFFALGRLNQSRILSIASAISFLLLTAAVYVLVKSLQLTGFWILVTTVMLVGYLLAPRGIWQLCVGTHANNSAETQSRVTP